MSLLSQEYANWNHAIASRYFSRDRVGQPVYLDLDDAALAEIGVELGINEGAVEHFIETIRSSLTLTTSNVFQRHIASCRDWLTHQEDWLKEKGLNEPPCIALLGFFAFVAEQMASDKEFSSSNYYGRLSQILELSPNEKDRVDRQFRRTTPVFWGLLNRWLENQGGARGYPTAFAFDRRRFVGLPISQALVRAADRNKLRRFFAENGFQPGQRASSEELISLLNDWIPASPVSAAMKSTWSQRAARERIAEVAAIELLSWDGLLDDESEIGSRHIAISIAAQIRSRPRLRVSFELLVRDSKLEIAGAYSVAVGRHVFNDMKNVDVQKSDLDLWLKVETNYSVPDALASNIELHSPGGVEIELARKSKRLTVLRFAPEEGIYVETKHAGLLEKTLLLAQESLCKKVDDYLSLAARPGYQVLSPDDVLGLPGGWVLFRDVQITGVAPTDIDDLAPLQVAASAEIALDGGFSLPGRNTWHTLRPPQISAVQLSPGPLQVTLLAESGFTEETTTEALVFDSTEESFVSDLCDANLPDGDYRVILTPKGFPGRVRTTQLRLRSGDSPRPRQRNHSHDTSDPLWPLRCSDSSSTQSIQGAFLSELPSNELRRAQPPQREVVFRGSREEEQALADSQAISSSRAECLELGYHHWILPPEDENERKRRLLGYCKFCGLEQWHGRWLGRAKTRKRTLSAHKALARLPPASPVEPPDVWLAIDALSYANDGRWSSLSSIVSRVDDSPWFSSEFSKLLEAFGHIEVVLDERTMRPASWSMCPPTIATVHDRHAIFLGARSSKLLERLRDDVNALGGTVLEEQAGNFPGVDILDLEESDVYEVSRSLSEAIGVQVHFARRPGVALALALPCFAALYEHLPTADIGRQDLSIFDLGIGAWTVSTEFDQPGAYRLGDRVRRYGVANSEDVESRRVKLGDHRTVKHLAAIQSGQSLCAFDPETGALIVPLGAELPGLYERAVVLATGKPPSVSAGTVLYQGVDSTVGQQICWKLSGIQE